MSANAATATNNEILKYTLGDLLKLAAVKASLPNPIPVKKTAPALKVVPKTPNKDKPIVLTEETDSDGRVFLVLSAPFSKFFNGFCYYEIKEKGHETWKWEPKRAVRRIPFEHVAMLMECLRKSYPGKTLTMGGDKIVL